MRIVKAAVAAVSSMFGNVSASLTRPVSGGWGWLRESFSGAWQRGITADPTDSVLAFAAVYACVSRIATDIAKLGIRVMQRGTDGVWRPATALKVLRRPNAYQTRLQFITAWLTSKLIWGNTYVLIVGDFLHVLDPRRVTPMVAPTGDVFYQIAGDDLAGITSGQTVPASVIIHDRAVCLFHPLMGVSPLFACAISATQGRRIQSNSATFFENMSRPSGMLTAPAKISTETAARLKSEWEENYSGNNIGRLAVMGDGLKYEPMTIPAEAAQLIEQLNWTVEDVARAYAVPLYKINAGPMPTSNNVAALEQQYYSGTLQINIESIESLLDDGLRLPEGRRVEFDLDDLLRMDSATQVDALSKAVGGAIMSPDEARARLNLPAVPGGASIYLQQQYFSLAALAKRDAGDPFATDEPAENEPKEPMEPDPEEDMTEMALLALNRKDAEALHVV